jgi:hypothetical protein
LPMHSAQETFAQLGVPSPDEATVAAWMATLAARPAGAPAFFCDDYVRESCRSLAMGADVEAALVAGAAALRTCEAACRLAHFVHHCDAFKSFPMSAQGRLECPGGALFWALLFLSRLGKIREFHRARGVSDEISRDTLSDLELWIREHKRLKGEWGMNMPWWIANHFTGRIFKLGRLQFETHVFHDELAAYRNTTTRQVIVFAVAGEFRADGQYASADGGRGAAAFSTTFTDDGTTISGHPISQRGFVLREKIDLPASQWMRILGHGDPVLGIHIPATGPMDHAACGESMRRAGPFFATHFPDRPFTALTCSSWLLDPQLEQYLPAESNLVRFLSEFYLYPTPGASNHQTYERVFDDAKIEIPTAPQRSSLQRAIVQHVNAGGRWRSGGALYFPEDLGWGEQVYRRRTAGILPARE